MKKIICFSVLVFSFLLISKNVQAAACSNFPNSHWDSSSSQCVCDSGYTDSYGGNDQHAIDCQANSKANSSATSDCPTGQYRDYNGNCQSFEEGYQAGTNGSITSTKCDSGFSEINGVCFPANTSLPSSDVKTIVTNVLNWLLAIFGLLALIAFVISGIQYIISTGSEEMIDTAKRNMTWSIVGVVVALAGLVIIYAIDKLLRGVSYF